MDAQAFGRLDAVARYSMYQSSQAENAALAAALQALLVDANRLCDRNLGGTYEEDCGRSIEQARTVLQGLQGETISTEDAS